MEPIDDRGIVPCEVDLAAWADISYQRGFLSVLAAGQVWVVRSYDGADSRNLTNDRITRLFSWNVPWIALTICGKQTNVAMGVHRMYKGQSCGEKRKENRSLGLHYEQIEGMCNVEDQLSTIINQSKGGSEPRRGWRIKRQLHIP
jgi:hypothetical protein